MTLHPLLSFLCRNNSTTFGKTRHLQMIITFNPQEIDKSMNFKPQGIEIHDF
jgi:hypothetical protein